MNSEKKECQSCRKEFTIEAEDFTFYEKRKVPAPTHCPDCRHQRRLAIRNERTFYPRKCDLCGKSIITYYHAEKEQVVYCPECWYSDKWDPLSYGREFDFTKPFFEQFREMYKKVPTLSLDVVNCGDSQYVSYCGDDKRCYLDIAGEANQDSYYCKFIKYSLNCVDCSFVYHSELNYECTSCHRIYGSTFLNRCLDSNHCHFCYDLRGCSNCFGCWNLRNKQYYFFNKPYAPLDYAKKVAEFQQGSYAATEQFKKEYEENSKEALIRFAFLVKSEDCTGDDLNNCKNVKESFDVTKAENGKWLCDVLDAKDCRDLDFSLYEPQASVELISTLNMTFSGYSNASHYCGDTWYSDKCNNSQSLFGCIGLNRKKFCFFNKEYSEDHYRTLKEKVIKHMKKTGEWGEYFPVGTSGFGYNETVAQEYFPLTKEECEKRGWPWWEKTPATRGKETLKPEAIPDKITDTPDTVTKEIFACMTCGRNYKVIAQELAFYRKMNLPLPRQCPDCRHLARNAVVGERKLYGRQCMCKFVHAWHTGGKCPHEFQTTYSPDRPENVYCEECYNAEIV